MDKKPIIFRMKNIKRKGGESDVKNIDVKWIDDAAKQEKISYLHFRSIHLMLIPKCQIPLLFFYILFIYFDKQTVAARLFPARLLFLVSVVLRIG